MIRIFQNLHSRIEFSRGKICINMGKVFSQNLKQHIVRRLVKKHHNDSVNRTFIS